MGNWWNIKARLYTVSEQEYESRVSWEDLTTAEQELVCDGGCGVWIFGRKIIPDLIFLNPCCHHDFACLRGGDETVRLKCEAEFRRQMYANADASPDPAGFKIFAKAATQFTSRTSWAWWRYGPMKTKEQILFEALQAKRK